MLNAKKLMIVVLAIVTIGAGSAFAWTTSQTGHCHYQGYTLYPFLDWSYPGTGDEISGTWDTEVQGLWGYYDGNRDSVVTDPYDGTKTYYHGHWSVGFSGTLPTLLGDFWLVKTQYSGTIYEDWSGTWVHWSISAPLHSGTMTGTTDD